MPKSLIYRDNAILGAQHSPRGGSDELVLENRRKRYKGNRMWDKRLSQQEEIHSQQMDDVSRRRMFRGMGLDSKASKRLGIAYAVGKEKRDQKARESALERQNRLDQINTRQGHYNARMDKQIEYDKGENSQKRQHDKNMEGMKHANSLYRSNVNHDRYDARQIQQFEHEKGVNKRKREYNTESAVNQENWEREKLRLKGQNTPSPQEKARQKSVYDINKRLEDLRDKKAGLQSSDKNIYDARIGELEKQRDKLKPQTGSSPNPTNNWANKHRYTKAKWQSSTLEHPSNSQVVTSNNAPAKSSLNTAQPMWKKGKNNVSSDPTDPKNYPGAHSVTIRGNEVIPNYNNPDPGHTMHNDSRPVPMPTYNSRPVPMPTYNSRLVPSPGGSLPMWEKGKSNTNIEPASRTVPEKRNPQAGTSKKPQGRTFVFYGGPGQTKGFIKTGGRPQAGTPASDMAKQIRRMDDKKLAKHNRMWDKRKWSDRRPA